MDLCRRFKDFRPESHRPYHGVKSKFITVDEIPASPSGWNERKKIILNDVYTSMEFILERSKDPQNLSLAVLKPTKILRCYAVPEDREFDKFMQAKDLQQWLFDDDETMHRKMTPLKKLPFRFYYHFLTSDGKSRNMMIEDWEIGALFWNCMNRNGGDEEKAKNQVIEKCMFLATDRDLYLFVGSTYTQHVKRYENPFVIVGLFYPPNSDQGFLDL
jgi:hypothetical protein